MIALQALLAAFLGRAVIISIIRAFFMRPRPFVIAKVNEILPHIPNDGSFPSTHTTVMFALAFTLLTYDLRWGITYLIIAFISGSMRVVVGVHFPLDIFGGILVGYLAAALAKWCFEFFYVARRSTKAQKRQ